MTAEEPFAQIADGFKKKLKLLHDKNKELNEELQGVDDKLG